MHVEHVSYALRSTLAHTWLLSHENSNTKSTRDEPAPECSCGGARECLIIDWDPQRGHGTWEPSSEKSCGRLAASPASTAAPTQRAEPRPRRWRVPGDLKTMGGAGRQATEAACLFARGEQGDP